MANPPAVQNKSAKQLADQKFIEIVVDKLADGHTPAEIAKMAAPDDPKRRKHLRKKIWRWLETNEELKQAIAMRSHAIMAASLPQASQALMKRAGRGRPDAIKLAFEASGFHNPKVQHEHSGDIKVTLDIPRPRKVSPEDGSEDDIVDAEVVDE